MAARFSLFQFMQNHASSFLYHLIEGIGHGYSKKKVTPYVIHHNPYQGISRVIFYEKA
jgi:hypothetical protein